jgi:hypothetical protein
MRGQLAAFAEAQITLRFASLHPGYGTPRPLSFTRRNGLANILVIYHPRRGGAMKTYEGKRNIDGLVVTVDGQPLSEHYDVKQFTKWGFEWTYEGTSPQQLALAILYDHLGDKDRAIRLSEPFMKRVVAEFDNDWILTSDDVERAIRETGQ